MTYFFSYYIYTKKLVEDDKQNIVKYEIIHSSQANKYELISSKSKKITDKLYYILYIKLI